MSEQELKRLAAIDARREMLEKALESFRKGDEIRGAIAPEDFKELQSLANAAVENRLVEMIRTAKDQLKLGLGVEA